MRALLKAAARYGGIEKLARSPVCLRENPKVETACVRYEGEKVVMEISPEFVENYLETDLDRAFVVFHEYEHIVRGDLLRDGFVFRRAPKFANLAMDIYINGKLAHKLNGIPKFLARLYESHHPVSALLLPPPELLKAHDCCSEVAALATDALLQRRLPEQVRGRLIDALSDVFSALGYRRPREAGRIYLLGWAGMLPFSVFLVRLCRLLVGEGLMAELEHVDILNEHDLDRLRDAAERSMRSSGRGLYEGNYNISPRSPCMAQKVRFFAMVRSALIEDFKNPGLAMTQTQAPGVVVSLGRRELWLMKSGIYPVFFRSQLPMRDMIYERVHIYVDVSGSMSAEIEAVYGLVATCSELIGPKLYLFSNAVKEVSIADFLRGKVETTYGTDLDCVAEHALKKGFKRILIVSDGFADISPANVERLKRSCEVFLIATSPIGLDYMMMSYGSMFKKAWLYDMLDASEEDV